MQNSDPLWYPEVITPTMAETLRKLAEASVLNHYYLAGGTGLALQLGHRRSVDFDFVAHAPFDVDSLVQRLQPLGELAVIAKGGDSLHAHVAGTKVSFLVFDYPVLFPFAVFQGVRVADVRDIA